MQDFSTVRRFQGTGHLHAEPQHLPEGKPTQATNPRMQ
jgi:hypothetical protein